MSTWTGSMQMCKAPHRRLDGLDVSKDRVMWHSKAGCQGVWAFMQDLRFSAPFPRAYSDVAPGTSDSGAGAEGLAIAVVGSTPYSTARLWSALELDDAMQGTATRCTCKWEPQRPPLPSCRAPMHSQWANPRMQLGAALLTDVAPTEMTAAWEPRPSSVPKVRVPPASRRVGGLLRRQAANPGQSLRQWGL